MHCLSSVPQVGEAKPRSSPTSASPSPSKGNLSPLRSRMRYVAHPSLSSPPSLILSSSFLLPSSRLDDSHDVAACSVRGQNEAHCPSAVRLALSARLPRFQEGLSSFLSLASPRFPFCCSFLMSSSRQCLADRLADVRKQLQEPTNLKLVVLMQVRLLSFLSLPFSYCHLSFYAFSFFLLISSFLSRTCEDDFSAKSLLPSSAR